MSPSRRATRPVSNSDAPFRARTRTRCIVTRRRKYRELGFASDRKSIYWRCTMRHCPVTVQTDPEVRTIVRPDVDRGDRGLGNAAAQHQPTPGTSRQQVIVCPEHSYGTRSNAVQVAGVNRRNMMHDMSAIEAENAAAIATLAARARADAVALAAAAAAATAVAAIAAAAGEDESAPLLCHADRRSRIVWMATTECLGHLGAAETVWADGCASLSVRPAGFEQLYAVHVRVAHEHVLAAFCLLPEISMEAYETAWRLLASMCPGRRMAVTRAVLDTNPASRAGFARAFPDAGVSVCRYHLAREWHEQAVRLGLQEDYDEAAATWSQRSLCDEQTTRCRTVGEWLTRFFGLTMLPPDSVAAAFVQLVNAAPICGPGKTVAAAVFADHVRSVYVRDTSSCPPWLWAAPPDKSEADRGTDGPERFWRRMRRLFRGPGRPTMAQVAETLHAHQADTRSRLAFCRWKKKMARHDLVVAKHNVQAWLALVDHRMTTVDYLNAVAYLYRD